MERKTRWKETVVSKDDNENTLFFKNFTEKPRSYEPLPRLLPGTVGHACASGSLKFKLH